MNRDEVIAQLLDVLLTVANDLIKATDRSNDGYAHAVHHVGIAMRRALEEIESTQPPPDDDEAEGEPPTTAYNTGDFHGF